MFPNFCHRINKILQNLLIKVVPRFIFPSEQTFFFVYDVETCIIYQQTSGNCWEGPLQKPYKEFAKDPKSISDNET